MVSTEKPTPRLSVSIQRNRESYILNYNVKNRADCSIYLFNKLYTRVNAQSQYPVDRDLCCVEVIKASVHVSKKIFPLPSDLEVEIPNIPCVTEVSESGEFTEEVILQTPLQLWNPYIASEETDFVALLPMYFSVGYFFETPAARKLVRTVNTTNGPSLRFSHFSYESQRLLTTDASVASVDVHWRHRK